MPSSRSAAALVAALLALAAACSPGDADAPAGEADAAPSDADAAPAGWHEGETLAERACPPDSFLSYQDFGSAFLSEYCRGCHAVDVPKAMRHGAPLDVNFDTLDDVRAHAARIYARAGDGYVSMPPAGGPAAEARTLLGEWLACGAPE